MNKYFVGFLVLVLLTSSIYIMLPNKLRIDIETTKSTFKVFEDEWIISGVEYVNLFDGTTKMRANSRSLDSIINLDNSTTITRYSNYKDNISIIEIYNFEGSTKDIELFPISHSIQVINGENKILQYEVQKLYYNGITLSDLSSPMSFGHNMKVEWDEGNYYSRIYKYVNKTEGKLTIKYRIDSNDYSKNTRLFDPAGGGEHGEVIFTTTTKSFGNLVYGQDYENTSTILYLCTDRVYNFTNFILETGTELRPLNVTGAALFLQGTGTITINGTVRSSFQYSKTATRGNGVYTTWESGYGTITTPGVSNGGSGGAGGYSGGSGGSQSVGYGGAGGGGDAYCEEPTATRGEGGNGGAGGTTPSGGAGGSSADNDDADSGFSGSQSRGGGGGSCTWDDTDTASGGAGGSSHSANGGDASISPSEEGASGGGGGGAGGIAGYSGIHLYINARDVFLNGTINTEGTSGGNGGNGGKGRCAEETDASGSYDSDCGNGGGAGGGGGGSAGNINITYSHSFTNDSSIIMAAGSGGAKGTTAADWDPWPPYSGNVWVGVDGIAGTSGSVGSFSLFQTNALEVTLNNPVDYLNSSVQNITFNATATDETGVLNLTLIIDNLDNYTIYNTTDSQTTLSLEIELNLSDGIHNWTARTSDGTGNLDPATAIVQYLTVDSTNPSVDIIYPTEQTWYFNVSELNFTSSDTHNSSCWYSNSSGVWNSSLVSYGTNFTINTTLGENYFTIYCNDTFGHIGEDSVNFTVDYEPPAILITYPENINYMYNLTSYPDLTKINVSISDALTSLSSCWYSLNSGVTNTTFNCNLNITGLPYPDELSSHTYWIFASDILDNINSSSVTFYYNTSLKDFNITITSNTSFEFYPDNQTHQGVQPINQTNVTGVITIHNNLTYDVSVYMRVNETNLNISFNIGNSSNYSKSIPVNETFKLIYYNLSIGNSSYLWAWANYNNPKRAWYPEFEIRGVEL